MGAIMIRSVRCHTYRGENKIIYYSFCYFIKLNIVNKVSGPQVSLKKQINQLRIIISFVDK